MERQFILEIPVQNRRDFSSREAHLNFPNNTTLKMSRNPVWRETQANKSCIVCVSFLSLQTLRSPAAESVADGRCDERSCRQSGAALCCTVLRALLTAGFVPVTKNPRPSGL